MTDREKEFFKKLRQLLDEYDVDMISTDDKEPYGCHSPLIQVQFNNTYGCFEVVSITSCDDPLHDEANKVH